MGYHFLVVDDEPEMCEIIRDKLKNLGLDSIDMAHNGQEAYNCCIEKVRKGETYSIIFSDWTMPKLNGVELLKKIRKHASYKNVIFVMITGLSDVDHIREALKGSVSEYLIKPFQKDDFERKVKNLLAKLQPQK